jgi:hypothetical protein
MHTHGIRNGAEEGSCFVSDESCQFTRHCGYCAFFLFPSGVTPLIAPGNGLVVEDDPQKDYTLPEFKYPSIKSQRFASCCKHLHLQSLVPGIKGTILVWPIGTH